MATGSFCSEIISDVIVQMCGNRISFDTVLVSEMVKWKMDVCKTVCHACGDTPKFICRTGDEAKEAIPVTCQWVVAAIECDDISSCSTTPKSCFCCSRKSVSLITLTAEEKCDSSTLPFSGPGTRQRHICSRNHWLKIRLLQWDIQQIGKIRRCVAKNVIKDAFFPTQSR